MRFGSTAKVLAKCMLKYYRISECGAAMRDCQNVAAVAETFNYDCAVSLKALHDTGQPELGWYIHKRWCLGDLQHGMTASL